MYLVFYDSSLIYCIIGRFSLFTSVTSEAIVVKTRGKEPSSLLRVFSQIFSVQMALAIERGELKSLSLLLLCLQSPPPPRLLLMVPSSHPASPVFPPPSIPLSTIWGRSWILHYFCSTLTKGRQLPFPDLSRKTQHDSRKGFFDVFLLTSHSYNHIYIYFFIIS